MTNTPAELAEIQAPIRIETYEFVPDSAGAGLALRRKIRFLADHVTVQIRSDRRRFPPYGLAGGSAGTPSGIWLIREGSSELLEPKVTFTAQAGDVLRVEIPGAGGYGPAHDRDPARVLEDILDGKVTVLQAERDYKVRINSSGTGSGSPTAYVRNDITVDPVLNFMGSTPRDP